MIQDYKWFVFVVRCALLHQSSALEIAVGFSGTLTKLSPTFSVQFHRIQIYFHHLSCVKKAKTWLARKELKSICRPS